MTREAAIRHGEDALDETLERLAGTGPEYGGGLANHAPMVVEALVELGRPEAVLPWAEKYRRQLEGMPPRVDAIGEASWEQALGQPRRTGDWIAFFERALVEAPWRDVVTRWTRRLAPGFIAAAAHGIIRTSHAVRALSRRETQPRLDELAQGLAYWAAQYQRLPERPTGSLARGLPSEVVYRLPLLPEAHRQLDGFITDRLDGLADFAPFADVAAAIDSSGADPSVLLSDLVATFAAVYIAHADDPRKVIAFIHAVTGPSAVRPLLPFAGPAERSELLRYAWQGAAAIYVALGEPLAPGVVAHAEAREPQSEGADELIDRAVATGDEHAIKFTETCLREHAIAPNPIFSRASADVVARLR